MTLIDILISLLIISGIALLVYLIILLRTIDSSVKSFEKDWRELLDRIYPLLDNTNEVLKKSIDVTERVDARLTEFESLVEKVKYKYNKLVSVKEAVTDEKPLSSLISNLRAFSKGFSSFWNSYRH